MVTEPHATITTSVHITSETLDIDDVSQELGIQPTKVWRCKESVAKQHPYLNVVSWRYEMPNLAAIEFSNALTSILDLFWPKRANLRNVQLRYQGSISFHLVPNGIPRAFDPSIDPDIVSKLADLNAGLTIHFDRFKDEIDEIDQVRPPASKDSRTNR